MWPHKVHMTLHRSPILQCHHIWHRATNFWHHPWEPKRTLTKVTNQHKVSIAKLTLTRMLIVISLHLLLSLLHLGTEICLQKILTASSTVYQTEVQQVIARLLTVVLFSVWPRNGPILSLLHPLINFLTPCLNVWTAHSARPLVAEW